MTNPGKDIYLSGGGELARELLRHGAVDEIVLGVVPVLVGSGIPAFPAGFPEMYLDLVECNPAFGLSLLKLLGQRLQTVTDSIMPEAAGSVIKGFGQFVVGGNFIVGVVLFLILVVIQFVVITKGAGRIAEVAARFTLDAMPGKQMAIDADLNAGLIAETEARQRRDQIGREADFYGAMDGAMTKAPLGGEKNRTESDRPRQERNQAELAHRRERHD